MIASSWDEQSFGQLTGTGDVTEFCLWENSHPKCAPVRNTISSSTIAELPKHILSDAIVILIRVTRAVPEAKPRFLMQLPIKIRPKRNPAVVAGIGKIL